MFEQFGNYPEIKWTACAAAQAYSHLDKLQVSPDLDNFKLERFKDLRKQPKTEEKSNFKLMLIGSSKTNIFIDGPDALLDILVTKLPSYIGKSWFEINKIKLERSIVDCKNFLRNGLCNPWIIDTFEFKEYKPAEGISYFNSKDLLEANKICTKCDKFESK